MYIISFQMASTSVCHQIRQAESTKQGESTKRSLHSKKVRGKVRTRREDGKLEGGDKIRDYIEVEGDKGNEEKVLLSERSIEVKEGHIVLGSVKWKEYSSKTAKV